jgi:hypothetical protein
MIYQGRFAVAETKKEAAQSKAGKGKEAAGRGTSLVDLAEPGFQLTGARSLQLAPSLV